MTHETWLAQKARLIDRFGKQNFSAEFSLLVSIECKPMPDAPFVDMVNAMIGNRKPSNPPLLQDFRDGRLSYERRKFDADVYGASKALDVAWAGNWRARLPKEYQTCATPAEAVELRKHEIAIAKADDPQYDPMKDARWV